MLTAGDIMVKPDPRIRLVNQRFNLQIKNIQKEDGGDYTCKISVMGEPVYITHTLEILGKQYYYSAKVDYHAVVVEDNLLQFLQDCPWV